MIQLKTQKNITRKMKMGHKMLPYRGMVPGENIGTCLPKYRKYRNIESLEGMENAVRAILDHMRSTDEDPHHDLCPTGKFLVQLSTGYCQLHKFIQA